MSRKRCRCHSSSLYASLIECPKCRHWSYEWGIGCERRKCGYEPPARHTSSETQTTIWFDR